MMHSGQQNVKTMDPNIWIPHVRKMRNIKRTLMVGMDHFYWDPRKGLKFLQAMHLFPVKLWPSLCSRNLLELSEFQGMNLDTALRVFLGTFVLPGESQKMQRVLEAFAERYYELSPQIQILASKDVALGLSQNCCYSVIPYQTAGRDDNKARMASTIVFTAANRYGEYICSGWKNILDCVLSFLKLDLFGQCVNLDMGMLTVEQEAATKVSQAIGEMWLRLVQGMRKVCLNHREEVKNDAILMLQRTMAGMDGIQLPNALWFQCFDLAIFTLLDDLLDLESSLKSYRRNGRSTCPSRKTNDKSIINSTCRICSHPFIYCG
ncbi:pattern formation protein, putative [Ricinus communis]|uniref:Pattern formation protein, putative n=1 Tax=Ricinus communis TaxID=3988 RepID=B9SVJ4_RICCO|nr:pattern formation protein, putative [Ricinus communis]